MKKQPLVSVFIPYYNDRQYLKKSIESVLKQTYKNFELILCNHATTDDCREIAHSYKDKRIKHVDMERNEGAGGGLVFQAMLDAARGKYIKTLCADDMLRPKCLEIMVDYMEKHPKVDFAFGNLEYIDDKGRLLHDNWFNQRPGFDINDKEPELIRKYSNFKSVLPYIGNISKREIFDNIEINKTLVMTFDMSLWLQLMCRGYHVAFIDEKIANYRIHSGQMSAVDKLAMAGYISWFENGILLLYLMNINDVKLARAVFPNNIYAKKLKNVRDIPFFVCVELFNKWKPVFDLPLNEMLNNDKTRARLMKNFGFGVKELRELRKSDFHYAAPIAQYVPPKGMKQKIYHSIVPDMKSPSLIFLLLRRLFKFVTFDKYRHHKVKKYSL